MVYVTCAVASIVFTELIGYWLHVLLHSEKVPMLSKAHMLHHLRDYGPGTPLHRPGKYSSSAKTRTNVFGVGFEWFVPSIGIIVLTLSVLSLLGLTWQMQLVFLITGVGWGYIGFSKMHSAMHLGSFWMLKVPILKTWFKRVRQLHDFHHLQFSDDGRMQKNYGICFFWFDRAFGTYSPNPKKFSKASHEAALVRYKDLLL